MKVKTKYNGTVDLEVYKEYCVNSIYKILPLKEKKKEWRKHTEGLLIELSGADSLIDSVIFTSILAKLEGLLVMDENNHELFRKIVLDTIPLVKKLEPSEEE